MESSGRAQARGGVDGRKGQLTSIGRKGGGKCPKPNLRSGERFPVKRGLELEERSWARSDTLSLGEWSIKGGKGQGAD